MGAFIARYNGPCHTCGGPVIAGQTKIRYGRKSGKGRFWHVECSPPPLDPELPKSPYEPTPTPKAPEAPAPEPNSAQDIDAGLAALRRIMGGDGITQETVKRIVDEIISDKTTELQEHINSGIRKANAFVSTEVEKAVNNRLPIKIEVTTPKPSTVTVEGTHKQFPEVLDAVRAGLNVYLWGAPGGGKSYAAKQVAEALSISFGYLSLTPQYPESRVMGYKDANGVYQDTLYYRHYTGGGLFCIDELDNSSAALLTALNSSLSNGLGTFPCGMVDRHPDFVFVGTGNTTGKASPQFPDRRPFDMAFADRLYFIRWQYDDALESRVVESLNATPQAREWLNWIRQVRAWSADNMPRLIVSPRSAYDGVKLMNVNPNIDRRQLADAVLFKGSIDRESVDKVLYANALPEVKQ